MPAQNPGREDFRKTRVRGAVMERCPTCGQPWKTHRVTWRVDGKLCEFRGTEADVESIRDFILNFSPLKRDNISAVLEIKE